MPRFLLNIAATTVTLTRLARGGASRRIAAPVNPDESWSDRLRRLDDPLRQAVADLRADGADVCIVYDSPAATVELQSTPAGRRAARFAARLALADATTITPGVDALTLSILARDRTGSPKRTHALAVTDTDECALEVIELANRVGLRATAIAPVAAVTIGEAGRAALSVRESSPCAILRIEDRYSTLTVSTRGCLRFLRLIDLGLDRLQEALTRSIVRDGKECALSADEAHRLLMTIGIPALEQIVDEQRRLTGADVLPLVQPVLQRLVVEVKQSLRFGMNDNERAQLRLLVQGRGAAVPGLGAVIAQEAEIAFSNGDRAPETSAALQAAIVRKVNALPPRIIRERVQRRARRGLLVGAAATALLLSIEAGWNGWLTRAFDARIAALTPVSQQVEESYEAHALAQQELALAQLSVATIARQAPPRAHWAAWLAVLSRCTPVAIELTDVSGAMTASGPVATIKGVASAATAEEARDAITHMIESLRYCPLVASVTIDGVRRAETGDDAAHAFAASITLQTSPIVPVVEAPNE